MISIIRRFEFDAGHRVMGHQGKCAHLHGHRYSVLVHITTPELNNLGMVIDFGEVKKIIGNWIDMHLDHNMILNQRDPLNRVLTEAQEEVVFGGKQPYIMTGMRNPTAEELAVELCLVFQSLLPTGMTIIAVDVWETPNCHAHYDPTRDGPKHQTEV